jgi:hypothetical protein
MNDERWFEQRAAAENDDVEVATPAPARLKSRIYSAVVTAMSSKGRLLGLSSTKADGRALCIFEDLLVALPIGESAGHRNPCRVCHARVLGERMAHAPIFWPGCPYSDFHNG